MGSLPRDLLALRAVLGPGCDVQNSPQRCRAAARQPGPVSLTVHLRGWPVAQALGVSLTDGVFPVPVPSSWQARRPAPSRERWHPRHRPAAVAALALSDGGGRRPVFQPLERREDVRKGNASASRSAGLKTVHFF